MTLNLEQLRIFLAVTRTGSFARAAQQLAVTPPAVSQRIRQLQERCGVRLFEREGHGVRLSPAGHLLQQYAQRIFALASEAERALAESRGLTIGTLRVVSSATAAVHYLPSLWAAFRVAYPGIQVQLAVDNSARVADRILRLQDDIGVLHAERPHPDLMLEVLVEDPLVAVVAPSHPWSSQRTVALADFGGQAIIMREPGSASRRLIEQQLEAAGVTYRVSMEIASHEVIKRTVELGHGIAIMSAAVVAREIADGRLWGLKIRGGSMRRLLHIAYHRQRAQAPVVSALLEIVRELRRLPDRRPDRSNHESRGTSPAAPTGRKRKAL